MIDIYIDNYNGTDCYGITKNIYSYGFGQTDGAIKSKDTGFRVQILGDGIGIVLGFLIARIVTKKALAKNPPINEKMIEVMMTSMGRKPSQKQVKQVMAQMNRFN